METAQNSTRYRKRVLAIRQKNRLHWPLMIQFLLVSTNCRPIVILRAHTWLYTASISGVSPRGRAVSLLDAPSDPDERLDQGKKPCYIHGKTTQKDIKICKLCQGNRIVVYVSEFGSG